MNDMNSGTTGVRLFIFHRDYRLDDNTTLIEMAKQKDAAPIVPIFIFTPKQIEPSLNPYFSHPSAQFLCESLEDLDRQIKAASPSSGAKLYCFKGDTLQVIQALVQQAKHAKMAIKGIGWNEDYSVFATQRDTELRRWCEGAGIPVVIKEDYGLLALRDGLLESGQPYRVLSQFYKHLLKRGNGNALVRAPTRFSAGSAGSASGAAGLARIPFALPKPIQPLTFEEIHGFYTKNPNLAIHGGRALGLGILKRVRAGEFKDYANVRDYPAKNATTHASPHLKFGTISIREMAHAVMETKGYGAEHPLFRELVFRDFYLKIYALQPELQRGKALLDGLDKALGWKNDRVLYKAWMEGRTGFPMVDAGMRELNATGFQHNRLRMLCSSVLTKYFNVDWRWGLKYYYQHLVDADIFSNTAGWGFSSSTGADAVPYFRAPFNPFIQSKKFDKDATYIHQWIPELKTVAAADIHKWYDPEVRSKYPQTVLSAYPEPIVDYKKASADAVQRYKAAAAAAQKNK
jgi:deoxyribodipyrimidine photo-lyase